MRHPVLSIAMAAVCVAAVGSVSSAAAQSLTPVSPAVPFAIAAPAASEEAVTPSVSSSVAGANASAGTDASADALPDAPEATLLLEGQAGNGHAASPQPIAPKYAGSILPGQAAVPLSARDKVVFAVRDTVSPYAFVSRVVSAGYSHWVQSQPHYGSNSTAFAQRFGAAYARGTVQDLATEAVFDPIFHDDPRYYVLGRQHKIINRAIYAATRVVITRTDSGRNTLNAPLLLGYAAAAGTNFAYYPHRDRDFGDAAKGYAGSLGGGVLGMEISEFIDDALHIVHFRH